MNWNKFFNRYTFLGLVFTVLMFLIVLKLFSVQIVHGLEYRSKAMNTQLATVKQPAKRGEILDRNGKVLADSTPSFALGINPKLKILKPKDPKTHAIVLKVANMLEANGVQYIDNFAISAPPRKFIFKKYDLEDDKDIIKRKTEQWLKDYSIESKMKNASTGEYDAQKTYEYLRDKYYKIDTNKYNDDEIRTIMSILDTFFRGKWTADYVNIAENIPEKIIAEFSERRDEFPGFEVVSQPIRHYPYAELLSQILGYTGTVDGVELKKLRETNPEYSLTDEVGKSGVEKILETELKGKDGSLNVEQGKNGNNIKVINEVKPQSGNRVYLTIDVELQKVAEEALIDTIKKLQIPQPKGLKDMKLAGRPGKAQAGSVVVLDVNTGAVRALVSYPSYDPTIFMKGMTNEEYEALQNNPAHPLIRRATGAAYPPGSTFKAITGLAGLQEGVITQYTTVHSTGELKKIKLKDWKRGGHGWVNLQKGMAESVNTYFGEVGLRLGIDKLEHYARLFGLGSGTGIEIGDTKGKVASKVAKEAFIKGYYKQIKKEVTASDLEWMPGETGAAAIGQSFHATTPIQLASAYAQIANGGKQYQVHLVDKIVSEKGKVISQTKPKLIKQLPIKQKHIQSIHRALYAVTHGGTGSGPFKGSQIEIAGKTGTSETYLKGKQAKNHAWFAAFAPYDKPEIAVIVQIEYGEHGGNAGYVARKVIDKYFNVSTEEEQITVNDNSD